MGVVVVLEIINIDYSKKERVTLAVGALNLTGEAQIEGPVGLTGT